MLRCCHFAMDAQRLHGPCVTILRGVSGAGKSSAAATALEAGVPTVIASADDFFVVDGVYRFSADGLPRAHAACRERFNAALAARVPLILLDNTNTQRWQYEPYLAAVASFNVQVERGTVGGVLWTDGSVQPYRIRIIEVACPDAAHLRLFARRNAHGVPWETLCRQWLDWEADGRAEVMPPRVSAAEREEIALLARTPEMLAVERQKRARAGGGGMPHGGGGRGGAGATLRHGGHSSSGPGSESSGGWRTVGRGAVSSPSHLRFDEEGGATAVHAAPVPSPDASRLAVLYVALFLTPSSRLALLAALPSACPLLPYVLADHVTLAHRPSPEALTPALLSCVGMRTRVSVTAVARSRHVQAALVCWPGEEGEGVGGDGEGEGEEEGSGEGEEAPGADGGSRSYDPSLPSHSTAAEEGEVPPCEGGDRLRAALLCLGPSGLGANAVPHITLSTARGVEASASNALLAGREGRARALLPPLLLDVRLGLAMARGDGSGQRTYVFSPLGSP